MWSLNKNSSYLVRKMQSVCKGVISVRHIYLMYHATPSLYYVIIDIYGAHVHLSCALAVKFVAIISGQRNDYTILRQRWVELNPLL